MSEQDTSTPARKYLKVGYAVGIVSAIGIYGLSLQDGTIHGPKLWLIYLCGGFVIWGSVLMLRKLIRGAGWVFPHAATALALALAVEGWLYLWFSH